MMTVWRGERRGGDGHDALDAPAGTDGSHATDRTPTGGSGQSASTGYSSSAWRVLHDAAGPGMPPARTAGDRRPAPPTAGVLSLAELDLYSACVVGGVAGRGAGRLDDIPRGLARGRMSASPHPASTGRAFSDAARAGLRSPVIGRSVTQTLVSKDVRSGSLALPGYDGRLDLRDHPVGLLSILG